MREEFKNIGIKLALFLCLMKEGVIGGEMRTLSHRWMMTNNGRAGKSSMSVNIQISIKVRIDK